MKSGILLKLSRQKSVPGKLAGLGGLSIMLVSPALMTSNMQQPSQFDQADKANTVFRVIHGTGGGVGTEGRSPGISRTGYKWGLDSVEPGLRLEASAGDVRGSYKWASAGRRTGG